MPHFRRVIVAEPSGELLEGAELRLLKRVLGEGGFGEVVEGVLSSDSFHGRRVAVKKMEVARNNRVSKFFDNVFVYGRCLFCRRSRSSSGLKKGEKKFIDSEISVLFELRDCEFVTKFYGYSTPERGKVWLLMEACIPHSFSRVLEDVHEEDMPFLVFYILTAMALALAHMNKVNLVHRDVKSFNFLLSYGGVPKLSDFGAAVKKDPKEEFVTCDTTALTPGYAAPEVIVRKPFNESVDVWSLAASCSQLLRKKEETNIFSGSSWQDQVNSFFSFYDDTLPEKELKERRKFLQKDIFFSFEVSVKHESEQKESLKAVLRKMAVFDVKERLKAQEILLLDECRPYKEALVTKRRGKTYGVRMAQDYLRKYIHSLL